MVLATLHIVYVFSFVASLVYEVEQKEGEEPTYAFGG
jgi:hypothetical protein